MLDDFLGGAIVMGFGVATLVFLKFWKRTREGLFLAFAGSFFLPFFNLCIMFCTPFSKLFHRCRIIKQSQPHTTKQVFQV